MVAQVQALAAEISAARGLPLRHPIEVAALPRGEFMRAFYEKASREAPFARGDVTAMLIAFGFVEPSTDVEGLSEQLLEEQIAGFYDIYQKRLVINVEAHVGGNAFATAEENWTLLLVHEIEHALQDQNFGLERILSTSDLDERAARNAVFEGDAQLVAMLHFLAHKQLPVDERLASASFMFRRSSPETLIELAGKAEAVNSAPPYLREALLFPYSNGASFVIDVYRTGGFPLVDQLFSRLPTSTHHLMFPRLYVAGTPAATLEFPGDVPGKSTVYRGRLGALGLRTLLAQCLSRQGADAFAGGWSGDAFTVYRDDAGNLSLAWALSFASPKIAGLYVEPLKKLGERWKTRARPPGSPIGPTIDDEVAVRAEGTRVVFTRGVGPEEQAGVLEGLLALRSEWPTERVKPLGDVRLAEPAVAEKKHAGKLDGRTFSSDWLGFTAELPEGSAAQVGVSGTELAVRTNGAALAIFFAAHPYGSQKLDAVLNLFAAGMGNAISPNTPIEPLPDARVATPLGEALDRRWTIGEKGNARLVVIPACGGRAALLVSAGWSGEDNATVLDAFVGSFKSARFDAAPACEVLE